ncbi:hypothetical protein SNOG_02741 [Parastagonospora nodorum SN15]|uniref:Uncharacterized protein n=1 Tax=Phaeosphaeria nodorum (strain SN15 / ATCC MYA-4574 / FGSC 10173) TaxID=321614 RepID=Q0UZS3_PHANO|nr:hypothetical protein SNOG_02741 [Parastagonospora nodorum SN15]EAT89472.1 hypothetical protein SNOG_02741 [Parastagonospora nodorum SN15]
MAKFLQIGAPAFQKHADSGLMCEPTGSYRPWASPHRLPQLICCCAAILPRASDAHCGGPNARICGADRCWVLVSSAPNSH